MDVIGCSAPSLDCNGSASTLQKESTCGPCVETGLQEYFQQQELAESRRIYLIREKMMWTPCPQKSQWNFVVGNIAGDPLHLLNILVVKGIIELKSDFYQKINEIWDEFTKAQEYPSPEEMYSRLRTLIEGLSHQVICQRTCAGHMVLFGGGLQLGTPNDLMMLTILSWLSNSRVISFQILLSENSRAYICCADSVRNRALKAPPNTSYSWEKLYATYHYPEKYPSLAGLLEQFYDMYSDHIKLVSYQKEPESISLLFPNFVSFRNIQSLIHQVATHSLNHLKGALLEQAKEIQSKEITNWQREGCDIFNQINMLFHAFLKVQKGNVFFEQIPVCDILDQKMLDDERLESHPPQVICEKAAGAAQFIQDQDSQIAMMFPLSAPSEVCKKALPSSKPFDLRESVQCMQVNIDVYPTQFQPRPTHTFSGDVHANPKKVIHMLIVKQLIELPNHDAEGIYPQLIKCINEFYTFLPQGNSEEELNRFKELIKNFKTYLNKFKCCEGFDKTLVYILGDDLADRGPNDLLMLLTIQLLHDLGLSFEITAANHTLENVMYAEMGYDRRQTAPGSGICWFIKDDECATSLVNFLKWVNLDDHLKQEALDIYEHVYKKHLKIVSYLAFPGKIILAYHGCVGLKTLKDIGEYFQEFTSSRIQFKSNTLEDLKDSIDRLNEKFLLLLNSIVVDILEKPRDIHQPLPRICWETNEIIHGTGKPLKDKEFAFDGMFKDEAIKSRDFDIYVLHGHWGFGRELDGLGDRTVNLDNGLGRSRYFSTGTMKTVDFFTS